MFDPGKGLVAIAMFFFAIPVLKQNLLINCNSALIILKILL